MTVTLDLPAEIAEQLVLEATRCGLTLEEFLVQTLRQIPKPPSGRGVTTLGTPSLDPYLPIVAGPPGSGKSTILPVSEFGVDWFSADDRAA